MVSSLSNRLIKMETRLQIQLSLFVIGVTKISYNKLNVTIKEMSKIIDKDFDEKCLRLGNSKTHSHCYNKTYLMNSNE